MLSLPIDSKNGLLGPSGINTKRECSMCFGNGLEVGKFGYGIPLLILSSNNNFRRFSFKYFVIEGKRCFRFLPVIEFLRKVLKKRILRLFARFRLFFNFRLLLESKFSLNSLFPVSLIVFLSSCFFFGGGN